MKLMELIILTLSYVFLSSCGNYLDRKSATESFDKPTQEKITPDFALVQEVILSARCISCHQQYSSYQGVIRELSAIQNAVATNRMPKSGGPLTDNQKAILALWISSGVPEKVGSPNNPTTPNPLEANWKSISENIIYPKCLVCHNPQGQAKFLDLSSRQVIFDQRNRVFGVDSKLINFESPEESYFLEVLLDSEEPMPPSWSNIPGLNMNEFKVLNEWIVLGLP